MRFRKMSLIVRLRCVVLETPFSRSLPNGCTSVGETDRPQSARPLRAGRYDFQLLFAAKFRKRFLVQPDHRVIVSTHDEQRRRLHTRQRVTREIGPSAARDYGIDPLPDFGRSRQRRTGAGARSEIADATTKEALEKTGGDGM